MARTKAGFYLVGTMDGGPPTRRAYPFASGTYYEGSLLRISGTSGSAKLLAQAGTSILGANADEITTAQSTATGAKFIVNLADNRNIFKAVMLASKTPQNMVGDVVSQAISTANCRLQGTSSTGKNFSVVGFAEYKPDNSTLTTPASAQTGVAYYVKAARSVFASAKSDSSV